MAEREARTETLRARTPMTVGGVRLLSIERVEIHAAAGRIGVWCSVAKEPYALVIRDAQGMRAVGTDAATVSLERLREEVPGLDEVLASL